MDDGLGFIPEDQTPAPASSDPGNVPRGTDDGLGFVPEAHSGDDSGLGFIPDENQPENKYSSLGQQVLTGVEGLERGVTAGLSDVARQAVRGFAENHSSDPDFWVSGQKDVEGRSAANPGISGTSQFAGTLALLAALPEIEAPAAIGKIGSKALSGAILNGTIQGGNEISKAMLGQEGGDPQAAASSALVRIGAAGLFGGLVGGGAALTSKGLQAIGNAKAGTKALSFLAGVAASDSSRAMTDEESAQLFKLFEERGGSDSSAFGLGAKTIEKGIPLIAKKTAHYSADVTAGALAHSLGGGEIGSIAAAKVVDEVLGPTIERIVGKTINKAAYKYAVPAMLKAMSAGETTGLWDILDHANDVARGAQQINNAIAAVFKGGSIQGIDSTDSERDNTKLKSFIEKGGVDQVMKDELHSPDEGLPAFAKGGVVSSGNSLRPKGDPNNRSRRASSSSGDERHEGSLEKMSHTTNATTTKAYSKNIKDPPTNKDIIPNAHSQADPIARLYPEQSMVMNATKARISTYLSSIRPQSPTKLPFDEEFKDPSKERVYDRAIEMANRPLGILNHIKSGELTPEHIGHFNSMYPELSQHLQKKLTAEIMHTQLDNEKPSYRVRQALSMFLGANLDSTMTPQNIQAAQNVFLSQSIVKQNAAAQNQPKKNTSKLSKVSDSYLTANEASVKRRNNV